MLDTRLSPAPSNAVAVPADYDGDGFTDFALKGSNGYWYIDVARCSRPANPETSCKGSVDDDGDDVVNDGCPGVNADGSPGPGETSCLDFEDDDADGYLDDGCPAVTASVGTPERNSKCNNYIDDDGDGVADDGCVTDPQCFGDDGYGGRWDFAYPNYGGSAARPVPADYGSIAGPADGKADLAVHDVATGMWAIDYADNGFGGWDWLAYGYGTDPQSFDFAADFDGDGRADIALWTTSGGATNGHWYFDYSSDGFGTWDKPQTTCPYVASAAQAGYPLVGYGLLGDTPAVGKFDADTCTDISVKTSNGDPPAGRWYFDLAKTGFGFFEPPCTNCPMPLTGYGDASWVPVIANYDPQYDGISDLGVKKPDGTWLIDYSADGYGVVNSWQGPYSGTPIPGNFDLSLNPAVPRQLDLSTNDAIGRWRLDKFTTGYGTWDAFPGTGLTVIQNSARPERDAGLPWISNMYITKYDGAPGESNAGNFVEQPVNASQLKIGVRYTVTVEITPGRLEWSGGIAPNPDLKIPEHLHLTANNGNGVSALTFSPTIIDSSGTPIYLRRFTFTCSQWGQFPLGFRFDDHDHKRGNPDFGMQVTCTSDYPGLHGTVTVTKIGPAEFGSQCADDLDNDHDGLTNDGCPLAGATIEVDGVQQATSDANGFWQAPNVRVGVHRVTVRRTGYSDTIALNVNIPAYPVGSVGFELDTPLEESFASALGGQNSYTTYVDYSHGRTVFHAVRINTATLPMRMNKGRAEWLGTCRVYIAGTALAAELGARVVMNGEWLRGDSTPCNTVDDVFEGYFYSHEYPYAKSVLGAEHAEAICSGTRGVYPFCNGAVTLKDQTPLFGIKGTGSSQTAHILAVDRDYTTSTQGWRTVGTETIYDASPRDGVSDFLYAAQNPPMLLYGGKQVAPGLMSASGIPWDYTFARTGVGTNAAGSVVWLVVADGEGIDGAGGASASHFAEFFKYLGASAAMNFDSGESTMLIMQGRLGWRRVNILTSENAGADSRGCTPGCGDYRPSGRLGAYISVGN